MVEEVTVKLLNFLAKKGLKVSKKKAQLVERKVKYLGHILTEGLRCIDPRRIQGILEVPLPQTKKELPQFLGLVGYCRAWIEDFSLVAKPLYDFLTQSSPNVLVWTPEGEQSFRKLKDKLVNTPVLALPDTEKEFQLYVDVKLGHAKGILVQEHGGTRRPVAYFSKLLDPVARGCPIVCRTVQPQL